MFADLGTKITPSMNKNKLNAFLNMSINTNPGPYNVTIRFKKPLTPKILREWVKVYGGVVNSIIGDIAVAKLSRRALNHFSNAPSIIYIESSRIITINKPKHIITGLNKKILEEIELPKKKNKNLGVGIGIGLVAAMLMLKGL